jgi:soluble lytic murein transglycosylase-like protein
MVGRMRAGDQPPWSSGGGGGGDDRWSHFDDTTSHLHFQFGERESDRPTVQLRAHRHERHEDLPWWRRRTTLIVASAFLAVLVIGTVAFVALRPDSDAQAMDPGPTGTASASASATGSATPSPTPTPTPTPEETTTQPAAEIPDEVPTAPPTVAPPPAEQPPPPAPEPTDPGCTPTFDGENAPFADVRAALQTAAGQHYWQGVVKPEGYTGDGTDVEVPFDFVKAVAYQESGWQSAIQACDGGMGTMQVMAGTLDHLNQRFGMDYSVPLGLQENAQAGANYLQWLLMYFGLYYYGGHFDPFLEANVGPGGEKLMLIDAVIAAYNVGPDALEGHDDNQYYLSVPNWDYVNAVWHFAMEDCPCDAL